MGEPTAIDGSDGELVTRRLVVWRRLEPGDTRTPGTEIAPESEHVEAMVVEVGIAPSLRDDLVRLWRVREAAFEGIDGWSTRYEPAGVPLALGGGAIVGAWLDYLPGFLVPVGAGLVALAAAVGVYTRRTRDRLEREARERWTKTAEHDALAEVEATMRPRWEAFSERLREDTGFRVELRVGDVHDAERLVSIDPERLTHPDTWLPDSADDEVRYGWVYADGRVVSQVAILEDTKAAPDEEEE